MQPWKEYDRGIISRSANEFFHPDPHWFEKPDPGTIVEIVRYASKRVYEVLVSNLYRPDSPFDTGMNH